MQHPLRPRSACFVRQLKDNTASVLACPVAALFCGAVEVAGSIEDQAGLGIVTIGAIKFMQYLFRPAFACFWYQLEDAAASIVGVAVSVAGDCAVEIAGRVEDQAALGTASTIAAVEIMQLLFRPRPDLRRQ